MTSSYLPYDPQQQMLLPHALQEWLPERHLAYYISDTVDSRDLSAFHARYAGGGSRNQPYHPSMMLKVLVYGYATGVFSSRKLAKKLHEDVAFRVLAAGNYPAHRTICDFRAFHLKELSDPFVQVVKLARECGLIKLGTIAVDGTKIKANASRHRPHPFKQTLQSPPRHTGALPAKWRWGARSFRSAQAPTPRHRSPPRRAGWCSCMPGSARVGRCRAPPP